VTAALAFTAHNIELPDGSQTLRGRELTADGVVCRAALATLARAFPGGPAGVRVADLGCLEGGYAAAFAQAGYDVTGFEARLENYLCCLHVEEQLALPNLRFVRADVRGIFGAGEEWDGVFACGILYHLDEPVKFLRQLGRATRRLVMIQSHYSDHPDSVNEGARGHWHDENLANRWSSWKNPKSFWVTKDDLMTVMRESFPLVFEQPDAATGDARSMFVGIKL
jgi:SAM-dependent methyltransferase